MRRGRSRQGGRPAAGGVSAGDGADEVEEEASESHGGEESSEASEGGLFAREHQIESDGTESGGSQEGVIHECAVLPAGVLMSGELSGKRGQMQVEEREKAEGRMQ